MIEYAELAQPPLLKFWGEAQRKYEDCSSDSGISSHQEDDSLEIIRVDFFCQHDGFFEIFFDESDTYGTKTETKHTRMHNCRVPRPARIDFECQYDCPGSKTSEIIDVDNLIAATDV